MKTTVQSYNSTFIRFRFVSLVFFSTSSVAFVLLHYFQRRARLVAQYVKSQAQKIVEDGPLVCMLQCSYCFVSIFIAR